MTADNFTILKGSTKSVANAESKQEVSQQVKELSEALKDGEFLITLNNSNDTIYNTTGFRDDKPYSSQKRKDAPGSIANSILDAKERFWFWIKERYAIHQKKEAGEEKPWTKDEVLQSYWFCNPYREMDKTTVWFRENIREPLRDEKDVLLATVIFRWFNTIESGELLLEDAGGDLEDSLFCNWAPDIAQKLLQAAIDRHVKVFTSAYLIAGKEGEKKVQTICDRITNVAEQIDSLYRSLKDACSLELATSLLAEIEGIGDFIAYEIVTDLRHTHILEEAMDILTWANIGPGASRGLRRFLGEHVTTTPPKNWRIQFHKILSESKTQLEGMPPFEMREVEHSLCEFDKFERARLGEGTAKRTYKGAK